MSCSLCRLPFTPAKSSVAPFPPPPGIMNAKQYAYFVNGYSVGANALSNWLKVEFCDNGIFGAHTGILMTIVWQSNDGTDTMFHTTCAKLVRRTFDSESPILEHIANLVEIPLVLGRPMGGAKAGRFRHVNYEGVGEEKVDIESYWYKGDDDNMRLNWHKLKGDGYEWTYARPDIFPRFHMSVAQSRFPGPQPDKTNDILSSQSLDVLNLLLPYIDNRAFVMLLSTCRTFRHHALTTFLPHARQRVLALGWAVPLPKEYASAPESTREKGLMANPGLSPIDGDWLLYLSNVHKTYSMRARRRLWTLAVELRRAFLSKRENNKYVDVVTGDGERVKSPSRQALEKQIRTNPMLQALGPEKLWQ